MSSLRLLALPILLLPALALGMQPVGARHPALSPDGSQVAFDWRGDIWIGSVDGGQARRLTVHESHDGYPVWKPDGKEIAFMSRRHGNWDVFVLGVDGSVPERLTWHSRDDMLCGWTPDGENITFSTNRGGMAEMLFSVGREGGLPRRIIGDEAYSASVSPDGKWIAYVRGYTNWWRKGYRGWASRDIWIRALAGGPSFHIVSWPGDDDRPFWSKDGSAVFFQSEREDGIMNLYRVDLVIDGDRVDPLSEPVQISNLPEDGLQFICVSGEKAVYEWKDGLWLQDIDGAQPVKLVYDCPGDFKHNSASRRHLKSGARDFAFSPGEEQVAFVAEGELYCGLYKDGEIRKPIRLTETCGRESDPVWLDENTLLFVSDREGSRDIFLMRSSDEDETRLARSRYRETERLTSGLGSEFRPQPSPDGQRILYWRGTGYLWTMKPDGGEARLLLDDPHILHASWSPDSRFIAYSRTTLGPAEDVFVLDLEQGDSFNVSLHPDDDFLPLWSSDGKRLVWAVQNYDGDYRLRSLWLTREEADKSDAQREREKEAAEKDDDDADETPPRIRIDREDIADRITTIATVSGGYWDYALSPDGEHLAIRVELMGESDLWSVDWDGDNLRRLTWSGVEPGRISWAENSETIRYIGGGKIREIADKESASAITLGFSVPFSVDFAERRLQKFNEAWRLLDEGFYDGDFHGIDWNAMREKYEARASVAVMTEDFNDVVREMIGELNASHLGVYGGPRRGGRDATGMLGFTPDYSWQGEGVRIAAVLPHGPLDREGQRATAGEVILSIDGQVLTAGENFHALLNHKRGEEVDLELGGDGKARIITVEPAGGWEINRLAYRQWTENNRSLVEELSDGRLAYLHMSAMGDGNWVRFLEDIFTRTRGAEGLILDVRNNHGGHIHDKVLTFLSRQRYAYSRGRGDTLITYNAVKRWDGPIVLLINERSYSDGEIFPAGFKALELGKVVGIPTFGAVIGTHDVDLVDGTGFRIPGTGWYRLDGRNLENDPVKPDVFAPAVPEEGLVGRSNQIEVGVTQCLEMLDGLD